MDKSIKLAIIGMAFHFTMLPGCLLLICYQAMTRSAADLMLM
jgi:hypothetical protein